MARSSKLWIRTCTRHLGTTHACRDGHEPETIVTPKGNGDAEESDRWGEGEEDPMEDIRGGDVEMEDVY